MEGGGRFESYEPRVESPEQQFREGLRNETLNVLRNAEDPLAIEIAEKILGKLDIKHRIDEISRRKDDPTLYQSWKQLGLFLVMDKASRIDYSDSKSGLKVRKGERILDIHLPPTPPEQRTLANVTKSMRLIAEYIDKQKLDVKYVMGVTFEKMAMVSRRQGFTVIEPEIPDDIRTGVESVYRRFSDKGINSRSMGKILLCYQPTDQFLQRYLKA